VSMDEIAEVKAWFARRGFLVRESKKDYSGEVRSSPGERAAPSRDRHVWVDLFAVDGRFVQGGYGSGDSVEQAVARAKQRYIEEQEG
jgi:hypothetical protein